MRNQRIEETSDLLSRLPRVMRKSMERAIIKPVLQSIDRELSPHHMIILKTLDEEGKLSISQIGEAAMIAKAQMTHSIDRLIDLGMLERIPDPQDRRRTGINITPKGKEALAVFDQALKNHMMETLSWLDDKELDRLLESLKFLLTTMEKLSEEKGNRHARPR